MSLFPVSKYTPNIYLECQEENTTENIHEKLNIILDEVDTTWGIALKAKPLANKNKLEVTAKINKYVADFKSRVLMFKFNTTTDYQLNNERLYFIKRDAEDTIQKIKNEFEVTKKENETFAKKRDQVASYEKNLQKKLKDAFVDSWPQWVE